MSTITVGGAVWAALTAGVNAGIKATIEGRKLTGGVPFGRLRWTDVGLPHWCCKPAIKLTRVLRGTTDCCFWFAGKHVQQTLCAEGPLQCRPNRSLAGAGTTRSHPLPNSGGASLSSTRLGIETCAQSTLLRGRSRVATRAIYAGPYGGHVGRVRVLTCPTCDAF